MECIFSTDIIKPNERFDYWLESINTLYVPLECTPVRLQDFGAWIKSYMLPNLQISRVSSRPQRVYRPQSSVNLNQQHDFIIKIQTQGICRFRQNDRDGILRAYDFVLIDGLLPYELDFPEDFEQIVLKVRADRLPMNPAQLHQAIAVPICGSRGAGALFMRLLCSLIEQFEQHTLMPNQDLSFIEQSLVGLLAAALIHPNDEQPPIAQQSALESYHIERVKQHIDRRLGDATISIKTIAQELNISSSYLHRLFQGQSLSASQYLWQRRLEACRRELLQTNTDTPMSISQIAYKWGFSDAAHFSRSFKSHFGCTPRQYKQRHF